MGKLVRSECKKLQFLKLLKKFFFVFRWEKTSLSALQALIRYKLLDSVVEKALGEDYSDTYVRFGRKKNPTSSELQWGFRKREKRKLERIKHNILLP